MAYNQERDISKADKAKIYTIYSVASGTKGIMYTLIGAAAVRYTGKGLDRLVDEKNKIEYQIKQEFSLDNITKQADDAASSAKKNTHDAVESIKQKVHELAGKDYEKKEYSEQGTHAETQVQDTIPSSHYFQDKCDPIAGMILAGGIVLSLAYGAVRSLFKSKDVIRQERLIKAMNYNSELTKKLIQKFDDFNNI